MCLFVWPSADRSASLPLILALLMMSAPVAVAQQTPVFRSAAFVVPVDVRVLDRAGQPVTDLTVDDFVVEEDGVGQKITYFATQSPHAGRAADADIRRIAASARLEPQHRRVFLIVLGRGRLQGPSKGLDALVRFVRERLAPPDQVAVMAWNRATDFTTDRDRVAGVLERFRGAHEGIESELSLALSGLGALYANRTISPAIQRRIDAVFGDAASGGSRQVLYGGSVDAAEATVGRTSARRLEDEARAHPTIGGADALLRALMDAPTLGANFDDYIQLSRQTLQDVGNLYAAIDYLRFIEGEKHLIYVTEGGLLLPSSDNDRDLGRLAADARVAVDTFQTGGVARLYGSAMSPSAASAFALGALRTVAETSGGQASASEPGDRAIDRIARSTEFGYVLGYVPANTTFDGRFRRVTVTVKRRDVTVSHRHGYFARRDPEAFDPRRLLATSRMITAAGYKENIPDLALRLAARDGADASRPTVVVDLTIAAERVRFTTEGPEHLAALSLAIVCADDRARNVGEFWRTAVDVRVAGGDLDTLKRDGIKVRVEIPVARAPAFVKAIAYDYGSDLVGSTFIRLR
jgi:VWFA-related protein